MHMYQYVSGCGPFWCVGCFKANITWADYGEFIGLSSYTDTVLSHEVVLKMKSRICIEKENVVTIEK